MLLTENDKETANNSIGWVNHEGNIFIVTFHGKVYKCKFSHGEFHADGASKITERNIFDAMVNSKIIPNRPFKNSSIERGEKYWFYSFSTEAGQYNQTLEEKRWYEDNLDIANYLSGNFFKTQKEAEMNEFAPIKMIDRAVKKEYRSRVNSKANSSLK